MAAVKPWVLRADRAALDRHAWEVTSAIGGASGIVRYSVIAIRLASPSWIGCSQHFRVASSRPKCHARNAATATHPEFHGRLSLPELSIQFPSPHPAR